MDLNHHFRRLNDALSPAKRVLLVAHQKPDGDALGSSTSFHRWLVRQDKEVTLFCATAPGKSFNFLDGFLSFTQDPTVFDQAYDAVIVFDSGDLSYAGVDKLIPRLPGKPQMIVIDHHATNAKYGDLNIVIPTATSTSEICYKFFTANDVLIDPAMATSLLTGILTDTFHFSNASTTSESVEIAGDLVGSGARLNEITLGVVRNKHIPLLRLWGRAMSRLQTNQELSVASTYLTVADFDEAGVTERSTDILINFLNGICGGVDTLMVLNDLGNGTVKGSMRSVSRNVAAIATSIGGGGHAKAAGFTVNGKIEVTDKGFKVI